MFGHRYFGRRYYGPRYFGPVPVDVSVSVTGQFVTVGQGTATVFSGVVIMPTGQQITVSQGDPTYHYDMRFGVTGQSMTVFEGVPIASIAITANITGLLLQTQMNGGVTIYTWNIVPDVSNDWDEIPNAGSSIWTEIKG